MPEEPDKIDERLGRWTKDHTAKAPQHYSFSDAAQRVINAFQDRDLLILARAVMKALEWAGQNPEYKKLHAKSQKGLRDILDKRR